MVYSVTLANGEVLLSDKQIKSPTSYIPCVVYEAHAKVSLTKKMEKVLGERDGLERHVGQVTIAEFGDRTSAQFYIMENGGVVELWRDFKPLPCLQVARALGLPIGHSCSVEVNPGPPRRAIYKPLDGRYDVPLTYGMIGSLRGKVSPSKELYTSLLHEAVLEDQEPGAFAEIELVMPTGKHRRFRITDPKLETQSMAWKLGLPHDASTTVANDYDLIIIPDDAVEQPETSDENLFLGGSSREL